MSKAIFTPVSVASGLLAAVIGKKLFNLIWGVVDNEEPPKAEHRDVSLLKLAAALLVEGALFALIKGLVDHGSRHAFARMTGAWPGDEAPDSR
jgi:Protein of unknown function (DUF4235)